MRWGLDEGKNWVSMRRHWPFKKVGVCEHDGGVTKLASGWPMAIVGQPLSASVTSWWTSLSTNNGKSRFCGGADSGKCFQLLRRRQPLMGLNRMPLQLHQNDDMGLWKLFARVMSTANLNWLLRTSGRVQDNVMLSEFSETIEAPGHWSSCLTTYAALEFTVSTLNTLNIWPVFERSSYDVPE